jgi:hypothetical protein
MKNKLKANHYLPDKTFLQHSFITDFIIKNVPFGHSCITLVVGFIKNFLQIISAEIAISRVIEIGVS